MSKYVICSINLISLQICSWKINLLLHLIVDLQLSTQLFLLCFKLFKVFQSSTFIRNQNKELFILFHYFVRQRGNYWWHINYYTTIKSEGKLLLNTFWQCKLSHDDYTLLVFFKLHRFASPQTTLHISLMGVWITKWSSLKGRNKLNYYQLFFYLTQAP